MTERETRKERKEKALNLRRNRIETAKKIMKQCEIFITAEERLLDEKEIGIEECKSIFNQRQSAKTSLKVLFEKFKWPEIKD